MRTSNATYTITDREFNELRTEVVALHGVHCALKLQKLKVLALVKRVCKRSSERDPRVVEALFVIFTEIYNSEKVHDVFSVSKSGMGLDCRNGSPAATFWRTVVALMPKVRAVRSGAAKAVSKEKISLQEVNKLKKRLPRAVCRMMGALLINA